MPEDSYTIDIPGAADIFKITPQSIEDPELKRQRIERWKTKSSPVPEQLGWIPPLITYLDDAQDLLYTGLVLSKPLLRRLPLRFVPYLGWMLTAMDAVNLITGLLSIPLTGTGGKRIKANSLDIFGATRRRAVERVPAFLGKTRMLPFVLQAGQAVEGLFGYGMILGPVMGTVSDTLWGGIRALQGKKVEFRLPPPADPLSKAARFLSQTGPEIINPDLFTRSDHETIIAAKALAMQLVESAGTRDMIDARAVLLANTEVPVYRPWHPVSMTALKESGIDPESLTLYDVAVQREYTTLYEDKIRLAASRLKDYDKHMNALYKTDKDWGSLMQMLTQDAGNSLLYQANAYDVKPISAYLPHEIAWMHVSECDLAPKEGQLPMDIFNWLCHIYTQHYSDVTISWCWTAKVLAQLHRIQMSQPYQIEDKAPRIPRYKPRGKRHWVMTEDFRKGLYVRPDGSVNIDYI